MAISNSGFTIVRNAVKLDYPFLESVRSLLPLCQEYIINCGDSSDSTLDLCQKLQHENPNKVKILQSVWSQDAQSGGFQLKQQTDAALAQCTGNWCFYLQADEVVHEQDYRNILRAIEDADAEPDVDGVVFDYHHFYGNYAYVITGRNWYRREVRAFKNRRNISAFRDAQGFRKMGQRLLALSARSHVYHYGYVRSPESLRQKSVEMSRWWGETPVTDSEQFQLRRHVGLKRFKDTHPQVMNERVARNALCFDPKLARRVWDKNEIKNAVTFLWESVVPFRLGEFRNYDLA